MSQTQFKISQIQDLQVLIVNGDEDVRKSIAESLEERWSVLTAASGPEALQIFSRELPEIILSDQRMSPVTGLELLETIKERSPKTRRLLMTGYADLQLVIDGVNREILQCYLTKPWEQWQLEKTLEEAAKLYLKDMDRFAIVDAALVPLRERLLRHEVYQLLTSVEALQVFMKHHCYAVWDFMCLLKCLQHKLTSLTIPWQVPLNMKAAHMINEIVVAEETDVRRDGKGYVSHFELYLDGMKEIGADMDTICRFTDLIAEGMPWQKAMERAGSPEAVRPFISQTLEMCDGHPAYEVAAYFLFGRENLIPDMFRKIVAGIAASSDVSIEEFKYYLDRHICLDEEEHGPASVEMMRSMCGEDDTRWRIVKRAAEEALLARIKLWDGIAEAIRKQCFESLLQKAA